jgi:lipid-binding SYLF domain-containing protein
VNPAGERGIGARFAKRQSFVVLTSGSQGDRSALGERKRASRRTMMQRRKFILTSSAVLAASGLALTGCTTTTESAASKTSGATGKRQTINADVDSTLARLYATVNGSRKLVSKARGVLVFPSVISAGFFVGGQYGEGALRVRGQTTGYYNTLTGSFGLQIGAQSKAIIFLFMTAEALDKFRNSEGWAVGVDATVAVLKLGANGNLDTSTATAPEQAFVLTNAGLMAGVSLEGTLVTRLNI